jgi:hypothetical protein
LAKDTRLLWRFYAHRGTVNRRTAATGFSSASGTSQPAESGETGTLMRERSLRLSGSVNGCLNIERDHVQPK